jgi:hypothetical protein
VIAQLAADLVAVEVALFQEAEDGHVQHCEALYRLDIAAQAYSSPGLLRGRCGAPENGRVSAVPRHEG